MRRDNRKLAVLGLFCSLAIIFGYVESLVPVFAGVPGIKLGLANLSILFILQRYTVRDAIAVSAIRILAVGFLFGNLFGIVYSLAGAAVSMSVMLFLLHKTSASLTAVSMAGGVAHNIGQLIIAIFLVSNANLAFYAPVLIISGLVTGLVIGFLTTEVLKRVP